LAKAKREIMTDIKFQDSDDKWSDLGLHGPWTTGQKRALRGFLLLAVLTILALVLLVR
jgi:hypothetical protein